MLNCKKLKIFEGLLTSEDVTVTNRRILVDFRKSFGTLLDQNRVQDMMFSEASPKPKP